MVLLVIDYKTRKVEIAGIIPQAHGDWMKQIARNLTDPFNGFLKDKKYPSLSLIAVISNGDVLCAVIF